MIKNPFDCVITCAFCKKFFHVPKYRGNIARYCSQSCNKKDNPINQSKIKRRYGKDHHNYKGGFITSHGYKVICHRGKRMYEHRYLMEKHLKRKLNTKEQIHHINGNKTDNRIKNMKILNISQHLIKEHQKGTYTTHLKRLNGK